MTRTSTLGRPAARGVPAESAGWRWTGRGDWVSPISARSMLHLLAAVPVNIPWASGQELAPIGAVLARLMGELPRPSATDAGASYLLRKRQRRYYLPRSAAGSRFCCSTSVFHVLNADDEACVGT